MRAFTRALCFAIPSLVALEALEAQAAPATAPSPRVPIVAVADGDSVRLYVFEPPAGSAGFIVYAGPSANALRRVGTDTIRAARNYLEVGEKLRDQSGEILRAANVLDEGALLRLLEADKVTAGVLMIFYPRVGDVMGQHWSGARPSADSALTFRVAFIDATGRENGRSLTTRLAMRQLLPATPTAVTAAPEGPAIRVTWNFHGYRGGNEDVTFGFNVYRTAGRDTAIRVNPRLVLRDFDKAPHFDDEDVRAGVTYTYAIRAVDILGREGPPNAPVTIALGDRGIPTTPAEVTARSDSGAAIVVWAVSPDPDVRGYFVERGVALNQPFRRLNTVLVLPDRPMWRDTTIPPSIQHFYRVTAVDSAGNVSNPSNPAAVMVEDHTPPAPPTALRAALLPRHRVQLTWTGSASRDVSGYFIYRSDGGGPVTRVTGSQVSGTSYIDVGPDSIGLTPGYRYQIGVSAIDEASNESSRTVVEIAIPDDVPPVSPTAVHALNVLGRYVNFVWSPGGSLDVKHYTIERSVDGAPRVRLRDVPANAERVYKDTAVTHGRRYTYWITAVDTVGNRSAAERDSVKFGDFTPPPSPRNAYARRVEGAGSRAVTVHWERVIDADLVGYAVYRSNLASGEYTKVSPGTVTTLQWTDPASPADAWYTVRAVDRSGNESKPSPAVKVPTP
jgi:fibronectin type 3 domain-containing protein